MTTPTVFLDLNREITTTRTELNYHYGKAAQCRSDERLLELNVIVVDNAYSELDAREDGVIKYNNIEDEGTSTQGTIDVTVQDTWIGARRRYLYEDDIAAMAVDSDGGVERYAPSEWPAGTRPTEEELLICKGLAAPAMPTARKKK